jgi:histidine triad (HIT) family protein
MLKKISALVFILHSITGFAQTTPPATIKAPRTFLHSKILTPLKKHKYKLLAASTAAIAALVFSRWEKTPKTKTRNHGPYISGTHHAEADNLNKLAVGIRPKSTQTNTIKTPPHKTIPAHTPQTNLRDTTFNASTIFKSLVLQQAYYTAEQVMAIKAFNAKQGTAEKHVYLVFGENNTDFFNTSENAPRSGTGGQAEIFNSIGQQPTATIGIVTTLFNSSHEQSLSLERGSAKQSIDQMKALLGQGHTLVLPVTYNSADGKYVINIGTGIAKTLASEKEKQFLDSLTLFLASFLDEYQAKDDVLILKKDQTYSSLINHIVDQNDTTITSTGNKCLYLPHHFVISPKKAVASLPELAKNAEIMMDIIKAANHQAINTVAGENLDYNIVIYNGTSAEQPTNQLECHWTSGNRMYFIADEGFSNPESIQKETIQGSTQSHVSKEHCVFCGIAQNRTTKVIAQNDLAIVIEDINPRSQKHFLVIPRHHIVNLKEITDSEESKNVIKAMLELVATISQEYGNESDHGFTFISNNGPNAHQTVMHMHWHFAAGSKLKFTTLSGNHFAIT